jgi:CubicO group peptidase (beta-lactamase class C family)
MFAAGLWTTPSDLARLAIDVQRSYSGDHGRVLTPAMTREMLPTQAGEYGLGIGIVRGDDWLAFSHGGVNEGYRAMFFAFADRDQGAVIMTSGDAGSPLIGELLRAVAEEYGWPAQRAQVREQSQSVPRHPAAQAPVVRSVPRFHELPSADRAGQPPATLSV